MKSGRRYALFLTLSLFAAACDSAYTPRARDMGAVSGATLGAGLGAVVGNQVGNSGEGLAIGAAAGALVGGLVGNTQDTVNLRREQQDEMLLRQQREMERQRREIEDLRRQEYHDQNYSRFEGRGDTFAANGASSYDQGQGDSYSVEAPRGEIGDRY